MLLTHFLKIQAQKKKTTLSLSSPKMALSKISMVFLVLTVVSVWSSVGAKHTPLAPAPAVDCTSLVLTMADCLPYVQNGSTVTKPEGTCCSGLKTVLKTDAECLCEAFKSSGSYGIVLDIPKAANLSAACKISAPSISNCGLSVPAGAPGIPPTSIAGAPTTAVGSNERAPAPAPGTSGSSVLAISLGSLVISLVVATLSSF
ncbi:LTP_2 domain-containing protein [Cephalotus follicularis]|uniref:LTP_2 domain-containing protein n=1 Tax=Cephalotus follicularis TaxID=3775 RepID=A0A1Q3BVD8_CEPFO|nr:LTP_2 domain-containing protein [Cephalotus follicularis]